MSKVILSMMVSLDGMVAGADGDLNWFRTDDEFETEMCSVLGGVDAILLGRVSYELLGAYWPTAGTGAADAAPGGFTSDEREKTFAALMNTIPKVVYSRTLESASWGPVRIVRDRIADDLAAMKSASQKDLVLFAGAQVAQTFMELDLVDVYRLMVHPVILGKGLPLFRPDLPKRTLRLVRTNTFASGVALLQYERE